MARFAKMTTNHVIRRIELFLSFEIVLMTICNNNKKKFIVCVIKMDHFYIVLKQVKTSIV